MIRASLLYPNSEGASFDFAYWTERHLPFVKQCLGAALQGLAAEKGVAGGPGTPPPYVASGHLFFTSLEAMQEAYTPHAAAIQADMKNFTNTQPVMIISEILIG